MKLRNKLIPIAAAMSTVAVVTPITLTSCGHRYTDMLHQYTPGVKPFMKTTFASWQSASDTYTYRARLNPDVIRDDVLFSISSIFNNKTTRAKIDEVAEFTKYNLDFQFYTEKSKVDDTITYINLVIWLDIAGKGKNLKIGDKNVGEFDLSMELVLYNIDAPNPSFETDADEKALHGNDALKDYYLVFMPLSASVAEITTSGTCQGLSTESHDEYNHHVIFDDSYEEEASSVEEFNLFKTSLFMLSFMDSNIDPTTRSDGILFGSHYFKDVTILDPAE